MHIQSSRNFIQLLSFVLFALMLASGQMSSGGKKNPQGAIPGQDYSGMYTFFRDGEFVQVTVEDQGRVSGFVSRYGDTESDRGDFLDHFFKSGKLDGNQLTFTTDVVHGISFEFKGTIERGAGRNPGDEAYYVLKGILVENTTDEAKKISSQSRDVAFKSFPQDMSPAQSEKK